MKVFYISTGKRSSITLSDLTQVCHKLCNEIGIQQIDPYIQATDATIHDGDIHVHKAKISLNCPILDVGINLKTLNVTDTHDYHEAGKFVDLIQKQLHSITYEKRRRQTFKRWIQEVLIQNTVLELEDLQVVAEMMVKELIDDKELDAEIPHPCARFVKSVIGLWFKNKNDYKAELQRLDS